MIVADVNVAAYLYIPGPFTDLAERVLQRDPDWIAPALWRHELLNVLATTVRERGLAEDRAMEIWAAAPSLLKDANEDAPAIDVLRLSVQKRIGTYDCEYVWLARRLSLKLVTGDKKLIAAFPDVGIGLEAFASGA